MTTFGEEPQIPDEVTIADPNHQPYPVTPGDAVITSTVAEPVLPTQIANPGRATGRSFVQATIGGLILVNPVFLAIQGVMQESTDIVFPGWAWATVNGVVIGSAAVSAAVTRVMAVPGFNDWIEKHIPILSPSKAVSE